MLLGSSGKSLKFVGQQTVWSSRGAMPVFTAEDLPTGLVGCGSAVAMLTPVMLRQHD